MLIASGARCLLNSTNLFVVFLFFFSPRVAVPVDWGPTNLCSVYENFRFLYDGSRINDEDTPQSLEMEDNGNVVSFLFSVSSPVVLIGPISKPSDRHHRRYG